MGQLFIVLAVALVGAAIVWGVAVLITGSDRGLEPVEPDGRADPLPGSRPLTEADLGAVRFDTAVRGYRMEQVDQALRRAAYDLGYKEELINVLEAEVSALREGRPDEAERLRAAREAARRPQVEAVPVGDGAVGTVDAPSGTPVDQDATVNGEPADAPVAVRTDAPGTTPSDAATGGPEVGSGPAVGSGPEVGSGPTASDEPADGAGVDDGAGPDAADATAGAVGGSRASESPA